MTVTRHLILDTQSVLYWAVRKGGLAFRSRGMMRETIPRPLDGSSCDIL